MQLTANGEYGHLFGSVNYRWHDGFDTVYYAYLRWKLTVRAQWAYYYYDTPERRIAMGALFEPFKIAAEASVPSLNFT